MAFQISPGVNVTETDLTTIIPIIAATKAGFAGVFNWGPADDIILVDSENTLVDVFQTPDDNNFEHFFTAANYLGYGNSLQVVRVVDAAAMNAGATDDSPQQIKNKTVYDNTPATTLDNAGAWIAKYPGALGNSLLVSAADATAFGDRSLGGTASTTSGSVTVTGTNTTFTSQVAVGDIFVVNGESLTVASITSNTALTVETAATNTVVGVTAVATWAYQSEFDSAPGTSTFVSNRGGSDDELHVVVVDEDGEWSGTKGTVLERFAFVSKATNGRKDTGAANFYKTVINDTSKYVWWADNIATAWAGLGATSSFGGFPIAGSGTIHPVTHSLVGGLNGSSTPTLNAVNSGYNLFADSETVDVSLLLSGPATPTLAGAIVDIVDARKDCVAFVSPEKTDVVNVPGSERANVLDFRNTQLNKSSSYSVLDCGWKYQYDRYNDVFRYVPLNGDIAGLCARTDETNDPWWSPAGFNRGQLRGVVKLAWNPVKADRDDLYKAGVNPVVSFPGEGTVLYGDKTLQTKPSAFDRINVRRLFIILEKAIATASKFTLFEFNDEFTRSQFKNMIEPFLRDIQGRRGITDFKVVCDSTNNTAEVIDRNEFVADIFIKPNRSINFIQLNFVAARTGVDFSEIGGFGL